MTSYPAAKIKQQMLSVKDPLELKVPGVCRVPCIFGQVTWVRHGELSVSEIQKIQDTDIRLG